MAATAGALAAGGSVPALAADVPSHADRVFIQSDYRDGFYEIASAKAVLAKKGVAAPTRRLARSIVARHTKEVADLGRLAADQGVTVSSTLTRFQRAEVRNFHDQAADDLSASFLKDEYEDHLDDIKGYGSRRAHTKDAAVRSYIHRWLPVYRLHIRLAETGYKQLTGRSLS